LLFYLRAPSARAGNKLLTIRRPQTRRRQQRRPTGNTKTMIFGCEHLVWYCSQLFVLEPGDVIATGTPPGVAFGMKPVQKWPKVGDVVKMGIEGLGATAKNSAVQDVTVIAGRERRGRLTVHFRAEFVAGPRRKMAPRRRGRVRPERRILTPISCNFLAVIAKTVASSAVECLAPASPKRDRSI
jgi:Fumarylacetoacetate (FAA) hydrolase family